VLHIEADSLAEHGEPGMRELDDGTRVSAETSRRLCCDASRVVLTKSVDGRIVGVGRRTRTIPSALRRALEARDRGCRFPGCGLRFTDGHHIVHWADGGGTDLENTVLLCGRHHRLVHEEGHRVCMDKEGQVVFFNPSGTAIGATGRPPELGGDPVGDIVRQNRERGVEPRWDTGMPRRHRDPADVEADAWHALDLAAAQGSPAASIGGTAVR
jgi:hypothetical protein